MSYWLISVPNGAKQEKAVFAELDSSTRSISKNHLFRIPQLKVGTLDTLMALSDDLAKYDTAVGAVAKKIEKTYFDLQKAEEEKKEGDAEGGAAKKDKAGKQVEVEQLKIGNSTARDFVEKFSWNETRYPKRSPLRTLTDLITKESAKSDEALKKQLAEYNDVKGQYAAIERKDTGTLLVKSLAGLVKEKDVIEKGHISTLLVVIPRVRCDEFETQYEGMEEMQREKDEAERKRKTEEGRGRKEEESKRKEEEKSKSAAESSVASGTNHGAEGDEEEESKENDEAEAERRQKQAEDKAAAEEAARLREEKEAAKYKRLPCPIVVPRSAKKLFDDGKDEFVLYRFLVIKEGAEYIKAVCRERRWTVRAYTFDPAEEKAEKGRKTDLATKKKQLWAYLLRWCSTTYAEIFSSWVHLKAVRLYVESVLRYGLPVNFTAMLLEPGRGREKKLREELKGLYGKLAGGNVNLASAENEPDIGGLTTGEFYPYVYLTLNLLE